MKRFFLLCAMVLIATMPVLAYDFSAVAPSGQTLYYDIKAPTTVECVGPGGSIVTTWDGYIKPSGSLTIPDSVAYAGITYSVNSIGKYAFHGCKNLSSINIPSSVTQIGSQAFENDTALHSIVLPVSEILIGWCVFNGTGWWNDQPDGLVCIGNVLIGYKGTIPVNYSLAIPQNIISLAGGSANPSKYRIASVTFPQSLKFIGDNAFNDCSISSLILPDSLKIIGERAFYGNLITTITIPSSVKSIGSWAFASCGLLTSVTYNAVDASVIPFANGIVYSPFYNCQALSSVTFGNAVQTIPNSLFEGRTGISGMLALPSSLQSIEDYAFSGCTGISGLSLPTSLLGIGNGSFRGCMGISGELVLPNQLHIIGYHAFSDCSGITSLTIGTDMDSIDSWAFSGMTNLTSVNYNAIGCAYAQYAFANMNISQFNIGSSVQSIPDYCVSSCPNLQSVSFPNTLINIGDYNFMNCGLNGVVELPEYLSNIGCFAFGGCLGITSVQCNAPVPPIVEQSNGYYFIFNASLLVPLYVPCASVGAYQAAPGWSNFTNISGIGECGYTVSLSVNNASMGTVSGGGTYNAGATATISATAYSGYHFDHWSDGSTQNPRTVAVNSNMSLTAYFAQDAVQTYTLTLNVNNASMGTVSGGGTYDAGATATISATAYSGYHFDHWSGGSTQNPRTVTVTGNKTFTAYFVQDVEYYVLTLMPNNYAMGSVAGGGTYEEGWVVTCVAYPNSGYHFDHWSDGETGNPRRIVMTDDMTMIAYFESNVGIGEAEGLGMTVYAQGDKIHVDHARGEAVEVWSVDGRMIGTTDNAAEQMSFAAPSSGGYIVKIGTHPARKVMVKRQAAY